MESCFIFCIFCSYRPFCRHPGCPGRKTMKAQSLLFRTSTLHFQHRPQKTTHDVLTPPRCYFSAVALPSLCLPACPPCFLAARSPPQIFFISFPFSFKMCSGRCGGGSDRGGMAQGAGSRAGLCSPPFIIISCF